MLRYFSWGVIGVGLLFLGRALPVQEAVTALRHGVQTLGAWGPVAFGGIYVLATMLLIPASLLTLAAGAVFGLGVGVVTVSLSSITGATLSFLVARYFARGAVQRKTRGRRRFTALDDALNEGGWKIVAMLRLSPVVPFGYQNYLLGVTKVRLLHYVAASWIAMAPGTFLFVYLGTAGGQTVGGGGDARAWGLLAVGLLVTAVLTVYLTRLARQKLAEQTPGLADGIDAGDDPASGSGGRLPGTRRWMLPAAAVGVALLAVGATVFRDSLVSLLGPPAVTLQESYFDNPPVPVVDHGAFDALLKKHVDDAGGVAYAALADEKHALDGYLQTVADAPFGDLGRDEKLALLLNAYNAATLRLMVDHVGIDSIKSVPKARRWEDVRWTVGGRAYSLAQIEHEAIRPHFMEPRIHWALVCAAVGCPPLRNEAYVGARLESQLEDQSRRVLTRGTRWYGVSDGARRLEVSAIMNWYRGDFEQAAGHLAAYVALYDPVVQRAVARGERPAVGFLPYDWSLNDVANVAAASGGGAGTSAAP